MEGCSLENHFLERLEGFLSERTAVSEGFAWAVLSVASKGSGKGDSFWGFSKSEENSIWAGSGVDGEVVVEGGTDGGLEGGGTGLRFGGSTGYGIFLRCCCSKALQSFHTSGKILRTSLPPSDTVCRANPKRVCTRNGY